MKKALYLILFCLPVLSQGQTLNVQKAHQNIVNYLKKRLNDPGSFSVSNWEKPEKVYVSFDETSECKWVDVKIDTLTWARSKLNDIKLSVETNNKFDKAPKDSLINQCIAGLKRIDFIIDSLKKNKELRQKSFKPFLDHYLIQLTCRAKNGYNALMLATYTFTLDKNLNVTDYEKVDD